MQKTTKTLGCDYLSASKCVKAPKVLAEELTLGESKLSATKLDLLMKLADAVVAQYDYDTSATPAPTLNPLQQPDDQAGSVTALALLPAPSGDSSDKLALQGQVPPAIVALKEAIISHKLDLMSKAL